MSSKFTINSDISQTGPAPDFIRAGSYSEMEVDLSGVTFFAPAKLVRIRCVIELAVQAGLQVYIVPPKNAAAKDYAGRMGLFEGTAYQYPYNRRHSSKFFPLLRVSSDRDDTLQLECQNIFGPRIAGGWVLDLADSFAEIANNVYFHSGPLENTGWGYAQAQVYDANNCIDIAVSDIGVGFLGSYQRTGQDRGRSEPQIMEDAFNELESSLNTGVGLRHRGVGLYEVHEFIKKNSGWARVSSGNSFVEVGGTQGLRRGVLNYRLSGVLFEMRAPFK